MGSELAGLRFAPGVENDLADAFAWYEERRLGLGEVFLTCVEAALQNIAQRPEANALLHKSYRRKLMRRFPYAVFYTHERAVVTVYCIIHTARHPDKWRKRLP